MKLIFIDAVVYFNYYITIICPLKCQIVLFINKLPLKNSIIYLSVMLSELVSAIVYLLLTKQNFTLERFSRVVVIIWFCPYHKCHFAFMVTQKSTKIALQSKVNKMFYFENPIYDYMVSCISTFSFKVSSSTLKKV